jgi:hypothetical protein
VLSEELLALMPSTRVAFAVSAGALGRDADRNQLLALHARGYRILIDGPLPDGAKLSGDLRSVAHDFTNDAPPRDVLPLMYGPHLAHGVDSALRRGQCARVGYEWFAGEHPLHPEPSTEPNDGTSRKRLLTLLGLLARDADSRELELLLKQDPALSRTTCSNWSIRPPLRSTRRSPACGQAISVLGRRQLQRWLQLLLYARQQPTAWPTPAAAGGPARGPAGSTVQARRRRARRAGPGLHDRRVLAARPLLGMPMAEIVGRAVPAAGRVMRAARRAPARWRDAAAGRSGADAAALASAPASTPPWWEASCTRYHWAIQVGRNV